MAVKCICELEDVFILPCSRSSIVGQIVNLVAVELTEEKAGKILCLAGF